MPGYMAGNHLTLLKNGEMYFPALLHAIDHARHEIFLESYLFASDEIGLAVVTALIAAARRGVEVNVLLDGFGVRRFPPQWQQNLLHAGVRVLFFRPEVKALSFNRQRLRRMHRKLAVIDHEVAYTGGINIVSDFTGQPGPEPRYDYMVAVRGPLVAEMHDAADRLWRQTAWTQLEQNWAIPSALRGPVEMAGGAAARFEVRDNFRRRHDIEHEYLTAIEAAQEEIIIACAYFLPGFRFRHALVDAAERGVRVVLLLQGLRDHALLQTASRGFYRQFLAAGMQIHEYSAGFMHAKVAIIDSVWATVGSSNIDPFSLLLAREGNVFVQDEAFASQLRRDVLDTLEHAARPLDPQKWLAAPWYQRAVPWLSHGVVRFLMAISGYGEKHYLK
ncbi:cardiolipin synthase ClsB [Amantichitinum ursilacus]|uniref:Cardiolipin synthase B n=1 Tax=Amantichitinum ursilacus TaxID=857265 RepID=A0A0N0GR88_9NEIS|nr:cardiolipin synthase ClsB [Amantichitinum ursilacus]KPC55428.1 putative cardiolipin synthase YbhO [Amantichitinum ursilacus]